METENIKALIIEDDALAADLYQKMFKMVEKPSFDVKWAENLAKALDYEGQEHFDVILMDLHLPDSKGFDTFVKVKARAKDAPIIILTG
ncbi:MAG: response regulator, partial [Candidatus Omnitrophota bacterium]